MKDKYFFIRILNLLLIIGLLFGYQYVASDRAEKEALALEEAQQKAAEERAAAGYVSPYKDGTFTGTAEGYGGPVTMEVVIKNGAIDSINVVSAAGEDPAYWNMAKEMIPEMVQRQDPNVDTVSGATYSSVGIRNAVILALKEASK